MSMVPYPPPPPPSGPVDNPGRLPTVMQNVLMIALLAIAVFFWQYLPLPLALLLAVVIGAAGAGVLHLVRRRLSR